MTGRRNRLRSDLEGGAHPQAAASGWSDEGWASVQRHLCAFKTMKELRFCCMSAFQFNLRVW
jgi:hypothetical protein